MPLVNIAFLILGIVLNSWDSTAMHKFRRVFRKRVITMLMNTLDRYIGKSILGAIFATLFTLVGLSAIIKFVEQFRSVGKGSYDIWQAVAYTGLTIPKDVETFFPNGGLVRCLNCFR